MQGLQISYGFALFVGCKGAVTCRWDAVALHKGFAKVFAPLQLCPLGIGPYDHEVRKVFFALGKIVGNALYKGLFGTGNQEVDPMTCNKVCDCVKVFAREFRYIDAVDFTPSITRGNVELLYLGRGGNAPCHGRLAPSGA